MTLNPIKHIDPIGTILMPLLLYFATSGAFLFGYAKPVPVNFGHLRHPKRDMIWVALAGPASNFIQAILLGAAVARRWSACGVERGLFPPDGAGRRAGQPGDVGLQPVSAAAARRRPRAGRPAAARRARRTCWRASSPAASSSCMGLVLAGVISTWWLRPLMGFGYGDRPVFALALLHCLAPLELFP